jgi:hypothetical protein
VSVENIAILQDILNFVPYWDESIADPVLWKEIRMLLLKYKPFLEFSREEYRKKLGQYVDLQS